MNPLNVAVARGVRRYPGLLDDPDTIPREDLRTTWGGTPTELTDATVDAARRALRWMVEEGESGGMHLRFVMAHRQSNDDRRSDPGQEIWQRVVLDFAVPELGLIVLPESTWRDGRSIPTEWDESNGIGSY